MIAGQRKTVQVLRVPMRAFGGGHGSQNHEYKYDHTPSTNTKYKQPSKADIEYQLPSRSILSERFQMWVNGRWQVDKDDQLDNHLYNKYSAYHFFGTQTL